jgi:hypothetical protein
VLLFGYGLLASQGKLGIHADVLRAYTAYLINAVRETLSALRAQRELCWQDDPVTKRATQVCEKMIASRAMIGDGWPYPVPDNEAAEPTWSPVVQEWEAFKASERILPGRRERLPESVLRTIISRHYGVSVEGVTFTHIRRAAAELCRHYGSVFVIPEEETKADKRKPEKPLASTEFWKEREAEFRQHSSAGDDLIAIWFSLENMWSFRSKLNQPISPARVELFKSLAREAAKGLANSTHREQWELWLDALRAATDASTGEQIYCRNSLCGSGTLSEREIDRMLDAGESVPLGGVWEFLIAEGAQTPTPDGTILAQRRMYWETTSETIDHPFSGSANFCVSLRSQIQLTGEQPLRKRPADESQVDERSGQSATKSVAQLPEWERIEITFVGDHDFELRVPGAAIQRLNYKNIQGFEDRRTGKPNEQWAMLRAFALQPGGLIPDTARTGKQWEAIQKKVERTSRALRKHLGMTGDPFPYFKGVGYRARIRLKTTS